MVSTSVGRELKGATMNLESIKILWRQHDGPMSLWGIPYDLRPDQSPKDLFEAENTSGWVWLGTPGWWGHLTKPEIEEIEKFLYSVWALPDCPGEYVKV